MFLSCLCLSGWIGIIVFEEEDILVVVEESYFGNYIVVFDFFDGFFNIDVVVFMGLIWGIYKFNEECLINFGEELIVRF